jgi:hypothetical protein
MKKALFAAATLLATAACEGAEDPDPCTLPYFQPTLQVTVQDSVTGANVTPGSTLVLRSGVYLADSVTAPPAVTSMHVGGNWGTFSLTVRQTGYQSWTKTGIEVEKDGCVPRTVAVTARLKP